MVALHHRYEADDEPADVADARREVDHLGAGLSRALLATTPEVLRSIAERAARAEAAVARWQARVGERPALDPAADTAVLEAVAEVQSARAGQNQALRERHRLLTTGNGVGVGVLGVAGGFVLLGLSPMALPVAVAVAAAPIGPVLGGWMATQRCSLAARRLGVARAAWSSALEATGVETMGGLAAQRIAVTAWERRSAEAAAATEAARPQLRAWYRLAGPGTPPAEVDAVLEQIECLRRAQIRLLGLLLAERLESRAMAVLAPPAEVASPTNAPSWLDDALDRLRSTSRLRLWGS